MAMINRDPFARTELHRTIHYDPVPHDGCDWCGNRRRNGALFKYRTEHDGGRRAEHRGLFCSKPCHDAYHS
jgi:hypothetical protein